MRNIPTVHEIFTVKSPGDSVADAETRVVCEFIMDHWRQFTSIQVGIASRCVSFAHPAEHVTRKMKYHLDNALKIMRGELP